MTVSRAASTFDGMTSLTMFVLRHRVFVVVAWLAVAVVGVMTVSTTAGRLSKGFATPGTAGYEANTHILQRLGVDGNEQPSLGVLHLPLGRSMETASGRELAARVFARANHAGHLAVADFANTGDAKFVSADGFTTWALFDMPNPDVPLGSGVMGQIEPSLRAGLPAGASVSVTGFEQIQSYQGSGGGPSVLVETLIGAVGALVVLTFVFGSAIAIVPLLIAIPSILASFVVILGLTQGFKVSFLVEYLVAVMGLGVAIDYSLLLVTRWREEREAGSSSHDAIVAAAPTAGRAVVVSGLTVAIGLFALVFLPVPFLRSIGVGGMVIPLVAIVVATTLLPVMLDAFGPALDRHRVRRSSGTYSRGWERWGKFVIRRRYLAAAVGVAIVIVFAVPALSMNTGQPRANSLGGSGTPARTLHALERQGVPSGVVFPIQVLSHGGAAGAKRVIEIAKKTPGVFTAVSPDTPSFRRGRDALVSVIPSKEGNTAAGRRTVTQLRAALVRVPGGVEVGGNTAQNIDFNHSVYGNFPLVLLVLGLITFALLAREFRSVVLALKAVVINLLSLAASFGFLVLFWQYGLGSGAVFGVPATDSIRNWVPIVAFAFLFGLSMDYEVFLLSRMREEYDRTGSTRAAIVGALGRTGRLITSAAVILAISFASIGSTPDVVVEMIASCLAFGIIFDAVVVRTLLVPSLVAIMGRWNWWLPSGLARVLRTDGAAAVGELQR
jgi:RND superfamily putative drug exporter